MKKKTNDLGEIRRGLLGFRKALKKLTCQLNDFHNRINACSKLTAIMFLIFAFLLPVAPASAEEHEFLRGVDLSNVKPFDMNLSTKEGRAELDKIIDDAFANGSVKYSAAVKNKYKEFVLAGLELLPFTFETAFRVMRGEITESEKTEIIEKKAAEFEKITLDLKNMAEKEYKRSQSKLFNLFK